MTSGYPDVTAAATVLACYFGSGNGPACEAESHLQPQMQKKKAPLTGVDVVVPTTQVHAVSVKDWKRTMQLQKRYYRNALSPSIWTKLSSQLQLLSDHKLLQAYRQFACCC
jgi:hypothetical protein